MASPTPDRIAYKIMTADEIEQLQRLGEFRGSAADLADGFIHMSTATQLPATIEAHYRGRENLVLVAIDVASLGGMARWEPSRGGQLFPHLYGALSAESVVAVGPLEQASDGSVKLPA